MGNFNFWKTPSFDKNKLFINVKFIKYNYETN